MILVRILTALSGMSFLFLTACPSAESGKIASLPKQEEPVSAQQAAPTGKAEANAPTPSPITTGGLEASSDKSTISTRISGTVQAGHQGMASFKVAGHIRDSFVRVGDRVRKGQLLAQLEDSDFVLRERLAAAGTQQARIQSDQALLDLKREEQLRKENVTSQSSIERVTNASLMAKLGYDTAQINLESARKALSDSKLVAPYDGIVTKRLKDQGEYVAAGNPVYEIYEAGELEVSLKVPESFIKNVAIGKVLNVSSAATDAKGRIKITRVVPVIQEQSRTFEVIGSFVEKNAAIFPGQFVEAELD